MKKYIFVEENLGTKEDVQQYFAMKGIDGWEWNGEIHRLEGGYHVIGVFCKTFKPM